MAGTLNVQIAPVTHTYVRGSRGVDACAYCGLTESACRVHETRELRYELARIMRMEPRRDAVIKAARLMRWTRDPGGGAPSVQAVVDALAALEAAELQEAERLHTLPTARAYCHAATDGDCSWESCPQIADHEPSRTGRHCPLDLQDRRSFAQDEPYV